MPYFSSSLGNIQEVKHADSFHQISLNVLDYIANSSAVFLNRNLNQLENSALQGSRNSL